MGYMIEKSNLKTVTKIGEFAGKPLLAIHEIKDGEVSERDIIKFGIKKAKAILASIDDIKKFAEDCR